MDPTKLKLPKKFKELLITEYLIYNFKIFTKFKMSITVNQLFNHFDIDIILWSGSTATFLLFITDRNPTIPIFPFIDILSLKQLSPYYCCNLQIISAGSPPSELRRHITAYISSFEQSDKALFLNWLLIAVTNCS